MDPLAKWMMIVCAALTMILVVSATPFGEMVQDKWTGLWCKLGDDDDTEGNCQNRVRTATSASMCIGLCLGAVYVMQRAFGNKHEYAAYGYATPLPTSLGATSM
jgi:hypothetical protein